MTSKHILTSDVICATGIKKNIMNLPYFDSIWELEKENVNLQYRRPKHHWVWQKQTNNKTVPSPNPNPTKERVEEIVQGLEYMLLKHKAPGLMPGTTCPHCQTVRCGPTGSQAPAGSHVNL